MIGKVTGIVDLMIVTEVMASVMMAAADGVARKSTRVNSATWRVKSVRRESVRAQSMAEARPVTEMDWTVGGKATEATSMEAASMETAKRRMKAAASDVKAATAATDVNAATTAAADVKATGAFRERRDVHRDAERTHRDACR